MFQLRSIRLGPLAALGLLLALGGNARAEQGLQADAPTALEIRVLEAPRMPAAPQGERYDVLYRMEVISVLRSSTRVKPGDTILVRAYAAPQGATDTEARGPAMLTPGWIGVAYLAPDTKTGGPGQFVAAAGGDSFENLAPAPPSLRWTQ